MTFSRNRIAGSQVLVGAFALLALSWCVATDAQDPPTWAAPPAADDAPLVQAHCRVVDYGDDYAHYRSDQFLLRDPNHKGEPRIVVEDGVDLDGDGRKDDARSYVPFDLADPIPSPESWDWDREGTSYRFYIARLSHLYDGQGNSIQEGGGPNQDHSVGADDINMMGWGRSGDREAIVEQWGLWLWKKEDFLNGGDTFRVSFQEGDRMGLYAPRYWEGDGVMRFLVQDGEAFYLSEKTFQGGEGTAHLLDPTDSRWAIYRPAAPHDLAFDADAAEFADHEFKDIRAAGYYIRAPKTKQFGIKLGAFEVDATVHRPDRPSELLRMVPVDETPGVPAFSISACEVPYAAWQTVFRQAVSNCYVTDPGYYFQTDAAVGSMDVDVLFRGYSPDEPATRLTWLDAVAWCNALSEREGRTPCYYEDAEHEVVFRRVLERFRDETYTPTVHVKWDADGYRLPTLAEWARLQPDPSTETPDSPTTRPVGHGEPNAAGLYGAGGNAWEWVWDRGDAYKAVDGGKHIVAGGARWWSADAAAPARIPVGFRVVRRASGLGRPFTDMPQGTHTSWELVDPSVPPAPEAGRPEMAMVQVPEGTFRMRYSPHEDIPITISAFSMGRTEVTYAQWRRVRQWAVANGYRFNYPGDMGSMYYQTGRHAHNPHEPATRVNWHDALAWCNALSEMEGRRPCYYVDEERTEVYRAAPPWRHPMVQTGEGGSVTNRYWRMRVAVPVTVDWSADGYRLPTTFEWRWAVFGDATTRYPWGEEFEGRYAWTRENSHGRTYPVGKRDETLNGLQDAIGNVDEWCWDQMSNLDPYDRINPKGRHGGETNTAGGSFYHPVPLSALGGRVKRFQAYPHIGFRVVRCEAGTHPADGDQSRDTVLLDVPLDAGIKPMTGAVFRADNQRSGNFRSAGIPEVKGVKWSFETGGPVWSSPVMADGVVYFGSTDGFVYAVDGASGELKWRTETGRRIFSSPAFMDGRLFIGSNDGHFYAMDAASGEVVWKHRGPQARTWQDGPERNQADVAGSPAIGAGLVFVGMGGRVRGLDPATGEEKWTNLRAGQTQYLGSPALWDGMIAYGHDHTRMNIYRIRNAQQVGYCREVGNDDRTSTPVFYKGRLYYTGWRGVAYAYDIEAGEALFLTPLGASRGRETSNLKSGAPPLLYRNVLSSPAVADGVMVIGTEGGMLIGLDAETGEEKWFHETDGAVQSSPGVAAGMVYVGSDDGRLHAVDLKTGEGRWTLKLGGPVRSSPWVGDGVIFVGCEDGRLYAIE